MVSPARPSAQHVTDTDSEDQMIRLRISRCQPFLLFSFCNVGDVFVTHVLPLQGKIHEKYH